MDEHTEELSVADTRKNLADVINAASAHGRITYITSRGRRVAAIVPLAIATGEANSGASRLRVQDGPHPRPEGRSTGQDGR